MKRNIMLSGGKTYVISLPAGWIRKYGLKKGDEVDVLEEGGRLVMSVDKVQKAQRAVIDVSEALPAYIWWSINAAYIRGCDELEVKYLKSEEKTVNEVIKTLIGFATTSRKANSVTLKDVSGTATEFDSIFRRIFFMLESMGSEGLQALKSSNFEELSSFRERDYEINYSVNFCLRYLNKSGYENYNETSFVYSTLRELESLSDEYADLFEFIATNKAKLTKEYYSLLEKINQVFALYHSLFFNYNKDNILQIIKERYIISKEIEALFKKSTKTEVQVLAIYHAIIGIIFNLCELKQVTVKF